MSNLFYSVLNSIFIAFFILLILLILCFFVFKQFFLNKNIKTINQKKANTLLINTNFCYDKENNPFDEKMNFLEFKQKLDFVLYDEKIKKIIIDVDKTSLTSVQIEELQPIFKKLNKEKEVIAIATLLTNETYYLALLANKIYLENTINSSLILRGYSRKITYFKDFFKKIGVRMNILHIGSYKAAGENYSRSKMSEPFKENLKTLFDIRFKNFIDTIKERRNYDPTEDILSGNLFFNSNKNLIDKRINKWELLDKEKIVTITSYKFKKKKQQKNVIAIVSLDGTISEKELSFEEVKKKVEKVNDIGTSLAGVILQINSPGGSAYESSLIYSYLKEKITVPLFVSMKDVCASGGYYISCAADKMFANKNTLTGSIGVVSMYPTFNKLTKNLGLNFDGLSIGKTTEYGNLYENLTRETTEIIIDHMNAVYKEFKTVVIKARHMSDNRLERIAQGRVWTGEQAYLNGLVDGIKNIDEVIEEMKKYLEIDKCSIFSIDKDFNLNKYVKSKLPLVTYASLLRTPILLMID